SRAPTKRSISTESLSDSPSLVALKLKMKEPRPKSDNSMSMRRHSSAKSANLPTSTNKQTKPKTSDATGKTAHGDLRMMANLRRPLARKMASSHKRHALLHYY